jgi:ketosteroid isomerase-like protein
MTTSVADLLRRNLLDVFNERDADRRASAIAEIYADDVVWHEPDRVVGGREALASRAVALQAEIPGWVFRPAGPVSVTGDLGHLGFHLGPADQPPAVIGMDIARCKRGVIVELYTLVTEIRQPSPATITGQEAADRLAIRELIDAYAHCADRRDAKGQLALFTTDTRFLVFMDATASEPTQELHGRESLAPVFDNLNTYATTTHFNGQSTVSLDGDRATGETYCLAHHLSTDEDGRRTMMVASIRYLDEFVKQDGAWLFAERRLMVDWTETRPSAT